LGFVSAPEGSVQVHSLQHAATSLVAKLLEILSPKLLEAKDPQSIVCTQAVDIGTIAMRHQYWFHHK
jgi:hypothetical protein